MVGDIEKIWNESGWTNQARDIVLNLVKFPEDAKVVLILRHSQRNEPEKFSRSADLNLTIEGRKIAKIFGKKLPNNRLIRLYHSRVDRCRHTAEEIFNGIIEVGGESVLKGNFRPLSHIGIDYDFFLNENEKYPIFELFYRWAAGVYPPEFWPPLITYSQNAAEQLLESLESSSKNVLDIHITHDLHLLALRFGWFGLPPKKKWIGYLGGFAFSLLENQILLLDYGEIKTVEYPHWWKK